VRHRAGDRLPPRDRSIEDQGDHQVLLRAEKQPDRRPRRNEEDHLHRAAALFWHRLEPVIANTGTAAGGYRACPSNLEAIRISETRVRCTGHLLAISRSLCRCSSDNSPSRAISTSTRSTIPTVVSHSAQSAA